jgi:membrane protease YdiL (CAAX protease family)
MRSLVRRFPATALFLLALALGTAPLAVVAAGILPSGFIQLGALSASAAGFILAAVWGGRPAVIDLLRRVLIWRVGLGWWAFVLLFPAVLALSAIALASLADGRPANFPTPNALLNLIPTAVFLIVFAGMGEEFGWRGFAVPRAQASHGALTTSLIVGGYHALWHIPLFFVEGVGQNDVATQIGFLPAFAGYALFVIALGVLCTWLFNNTRGSVLIVAVFHGVLNAWTGFIDITGGRLAGIFAHAGLTLAAAVVVVFWFGPTNLARTPRVYISPSETRAT